MKLRALFLLFALFLLLPAAAQAQTPLPFCSMTVTPATINKGGSVTLKWSSSNATAANIPGPGLGAVAVNGQKNLIPTGSTRWVGTFTGPGGKTTCQAIVLVLDNGNAMVVAGAESYGDSSSSGGAAVDGPGTIQTGGGSVGTPGSVPAAGGVNGPGTLVGSDENFVDGPGTVTAPGTVDAPGKITGSDSLNSVPTLPRAAATQINQSSGSGIVPCTGLDCEACSLAKLSQNIINFLIGLSIPLAAALFAWAGVLYFSSSVVNKIEKARKIFTSVLIGFGITVGAWLIVQTILSTILQDKYKNWNVIQCVGTTNRPMNKDVKDLLDSVNLLNSIDTSSQGRLTGAPIRTSLDAQPALGGSSAGCNEGDYKQDNGACVSAFGDIYAPARVSSTLYGGNINVAGTQQYADRIAEICQNYSNFDDCAKTSQAIMAIESNGRAQVISQAGAVGLMQVMPGTARLLDSSLAGLSNAEITERLRDPDYNMQLGVKYLSQMRSQFSDNDNFIASYNGGPGANRSSATCPGQTYWQCTANAGYAETRNYVPKFQAARAKLN